MGVDLWSPIRDMSQGGEELRYRERQIFVATSSDGGRTFRELPNSYTGFYAHRGTI